MASDIRPASLALVSSDRLFATDCARLESTGRRTAQAREAGKFAHRSIPAKSPFDRVQYCADAREARAARLHLRTHSSVA